MVTHQSCNGQNAAFNSRISMLFCHLDCNATRPDLGITRHFFCDTATRAPCDPYVSQRMKRQVAKFQRSFVELGKCPQVIPLFAHAITIAGSKRCPMNGCSLGAEFGSDDSRLS
jgi:hypothetical protein